MHFKISEKLNGIKICTATILAGAAFLAAACTGGHPYDSYLADYLHVSQDSCIQTGQSVRAADIHMSVNSYYRGERAMVMLLSFERADGKKLEEGLEPEEISVQGDCAGEVLLNDVMQSEDGTAILSVLTCSIQNGDSDSVKVCVKNMSAEDHSVSYEGIWETEFDAGQKQKETVLVRKANPVNVRILGTNTDFTVKQVTFDKNTLCIECDRKENAFCAAELLSSYWENGKEISLEYNDGKKELTDLYCYLSNDGNLYLSVKDVRQLEGVEQIYLEGQALFEK